MDALTENQTYRLHLTPGEGFAPEDSEHNLKRVSEGLRMLARKIEQEGPNVGISIDLDSRDEGDPLSEPVLYSWVFVSDETLDRALRMISESGVEVYGVDNISGPRAMRFASENQWVLL